MTLIKDVKDCSTYSVRGLDNQIIAQMNVIHPNLLVRIDDIDNLTLGQAVHPWLIAPAKPALARAIARRKGEAMIINSAFRTIAGQLLLYQHCQHGRCGIMAAARPGKSNHNGASAIDIQDSAEWRDALEDSGWKWIGKFDPMHYDFQGKGIDANVNAIAVKAFQQLWNMCRPNDRLAEDGDFGDATAGRLLYAPAEGFPGVKPYRSLLLTDPVQIGDDVGVLQLALREAGIKLEKADKVFGDGTHKAVVEFQTKNNLTADGVVGDRTRKILGMPIG